VSKLSDRLTAAAGDAVAAVIILAVEGREMFAAKLRKLADDLDNMYQDVNDEEDQQ
jgi:hypothetical protein